MLSLELIEFFKTTTAKLGIEISDEQINKFSKYGDLLLEWNKVMNLTAVCEEREVVIKHFVDSMTIIPYIDVQKCNSRQSRRRWQR